MRGKVKWFSSEKGYGFITDTDGVDRYFHVTDVRGADLPHQGDAVVFEPAEGKKGPRAAGVALGAAASGAPIRERDDRVTCAGCNKRMIPRIITGPPLVHGRGGWTPVPKRSVCPFCGATFKKFPPSTSELIGVVLFGVFFLFVLATIVGRR
jgi:cold shock CspA family protein